MGTQRGGNQGSCLQELGKEGICEQPAAVVIEIHTRAKNEGLGVDSEWLRG